MSVFIESGFNPTTPLTHARIGYQSLLTSSNITASAAVSGFPVNNCLIDQTYEFYKPDVTDSTITVDLGTAQNVDYFGVVGRNMGNVKLESSTDNVTFSTVLGGHRFRRCDHYGFICYRISPLFSLYLLRIRPGDCKSQFR